MFLDLSRIDLQHVLQKIARPLGFEENELLTLAGYLSPQPRKMTEENPGHISRRVNPYVARVLAQESVDVQRAVIGILAILKSLAKSIVKENP